MPICTIAGRAGTVQRDRRRLRRARRRRGPESGRRTIAYCRPRRRRIRHEPGILVCEVPDGFVDNADDCDDEAGATSPGALEVCGNDGDENCDELAEECRLGGDLSLKAPDLAIVPQLYSAYEQLGAAMTTLPRRARSSSRLPGIRRATACSCSTDSARASTTSTTRARRLTRDDSQPGPRDVALRGGRRRRWRRRSGDRSAARVGGFAPSTDEVYVELGPADDPRDQRARDPDGDSGFAHVVSCVGDFDGDGIGDVAIGSPGLEGYGSVVLFLGGSWTGPLDRYDADVTITASSSVGSGLGTSLGHADIDDDGRADLVIGAPTGSGSLPGSGVAYVRPRHVLTRSRVELSLGLRTEASRNSDLRRARHRRGSR
jgi:hypothetical protein